MASGFTRIDLGREYSAGVNMPAGSGDALKLARANAAGTNLEYVAATSAVTADDTLATALAPNLRGPGLTVDSSGNLALRARPRHIQLQDYFLGGTAVSGGIGRLGWSFFGSGATAARQSIFLASAAKFQITTGATTNNLAAMSLSNIINGNICLLSEVSLLQFAVRFENDADVRFFLGFQDDQTNAPQADAMALGLIFDTGLGSNWFTISRDASAGSAVDSGVALPAAGTSVLVSLVQSAAGVWQVYVGNTQIGGTLSTNVPSGFVTFGPRVETLTTASKAIRIGYCGLSGSLTGVFDDDTFLEV